HLTSVVAASVFHAPPTAAIYPLSLHDAVPAADLTCRDPDDQVFLDLALHRGVGWLLSRDRQLLALRRRALARGLRILRPEDGPWQAALRPAADGAAMSPAGPIIGPLPAPRGAPSRSPE